MLPEGEVVILYKADFRPMRGASHRCLLQAAAQCGVLPPDAALAAAPRGKPYFLHAPQLHFSISHSGTYWVCAFAAQPVGFDLQQRRACDAASLARRFFHPGEAAYVDAGGDFFAVWCAKESYVKFTGCGIDAGFGTFCTAVPGAQTVQLPDVFLQQIAVVDGYAACLCTRTPVQVRLQPLDAR